MGLQEDVNKLETKLSQLEEQRKDLQRRASLVERKKRTRRLIEIGAIAESVLGREFNDEDKTRFQAFLYKQENNGKYFTKAMNTSDDSSSQPSP